VALIARQFLSRPYPAIRDRRWMRPAQRQSLWTKEILAKAMSSSILLITQDGFRKIDSQRNVTFSRHSIVWFGYEG
jgi:hypothetical protein